MRLSASATEGLIKPSEGYHKRQSDGSCAAYLCPAGKWTCGWGCTEGVTPHTRWSKAEATEALSQEMQAHEDSVERLVKVKLDQSQFDALVSLCYNIGSRNLAKSTLLRHLNKGDYARAASHFADWKYARVKGATARRMNVKPGTAVVLPGLVTRRAAEAALFLSGEASDMPQSVSSPRWKIDRAQAAAAGTVVATGAVSVPPSAVSESVTSLGAWQSLAQQVSDLLHYAGGHWTWLVAAVGAYALLAHGLPWFARKRADA